MTASTCGAEAILRVGGPVQIPLQPCCVAVLLRASRMPYAAPATVACPLRADLRALTRPAVIRRAAA
ncbi:hypothetical protein [Nucisporomicrobium flavum]|jgi:hypothetical protein|uniref:hypothetical protein n=1 Tax=Nucisporomicrobium flavum TaxID=2785915 RepID=UPI0018F459E2|nr:hypothetical protein [Nucisporomicrobium flavum]